MVAEQRWVIMSDIQIHEWSSVRWRPIKPETCGCERTSTSDVFGAEITQHRHRRRVTVRPLNFLLCIGMLLLISLSSQASAQSRLGAGAASGAVGGQGTQRAPLGSRSTVPDLPAGLERLSPPGAGLPVLLVPGLFLSSRVFQHGPEGGLSAALERAGFEVWAWTPWGPEAGSLSTLSAQAVSVVETVQIRSGKSVRWVGMELGGLLGLLAASEGAPLTLVATLAPRLELAPCSTPYERALRSVQGADSGTLTSVASSLWSRGDVSNDALEQVLLQDMVSISPALASQLLDACALKGNAHLYAPAWERLWLPVVFIASSRDGQAPLELLLEHVDAAPAEYRSLRVLAGPDAPSHLGLLLGPSAPRQVIRPLIRFLRDPKPDKASRAPMVPAELKGSSKKGGRR